MQVPAEDGRCRKLGHKVLPVCRQLLVASRCHQPSCGPPSAASLRRAGPQALSGPRGFLSKARMSIFSSKRNDPNNAEAVSHLSPYLHFGVIAPQRAALEAAKLRSKYKARARRAPCRDDCKEGCAELECSRRQTSLTVQQRFATARFSCAARCAGCSGMCAACRERRSCCSGAVSELSSSGVGSAGSRALCSLNCPLRRHGTWDRRNRRVETQRPLSMR